MTIREANQRLVSDLKVIIDDAEELLGATAGEAGERVRDVRARLASALESAKGSCQRYQDVAEEAARKTDRVIREHPYESLGTAFGVGLLIGVLVGRR